MHKIISDIRSIYCQIKLYQLIKYFFYLFSIIPTSNQNTTILILTIQYNFLNEGCHAVNLIE